MKSIGVVLSLVLCAALQVSAQTQSPLSWTDPPDKLLTKALYDGYESKTTDPEEAKYQWVAYYYSDSVVVIVQSPLGCAWILGESAHVDSKSIPDVTLVKDFCQGLHVSVFYSSNERGKLWDARIGKPNGNERDLVFPDHIDRDPDPKASAESGETLYKHRDVFSFTIPRSLSRSADLTLFDNSGYRYVQNMNFSDFDIGNKK